MVRPSAFLLAGLLSFASVLATAQAQPRQDTQIPQQDTQLRRPVIEPTAVHASTHAAAPHAPNAGAHDTHASAGHDDHAHGPPGDINWFYGFLGTDAEEEPSILWRRPDMPPPFLANIINFVIFAYILVRFAKKPLQMALLKRKETIMREIDAAQKMKLDAEKRLAEYQDKLNHIDSEVERIRKEFREQGEREHQRILQDAKEKREHMLKETAFMIEQAKKQVRVELMRETVEAAIASAEKILQGALSDADHDRLCTDYVKNVAASQGLSLTKGGSA